MTWQNDKCSGCGRTRVPQERWTYVYPELSVPGKLVANEQYCPTCARARGLRVRGPDRGAQ